MKSLCALIAMALLGVGLTACGGAGKRTGSAPHASSSAAAPTGGTAAGTTSGVTPSPGSLKGDEDDDDETTTATTGANTANSKNDNDADFDNDRTDNQNKGYRDSDDSSVVAWGQAANAADGRAVTALVKRYYAAAAAGDGAKACPLIYSILAEAIPEDYGQPPGPAYARGKTCAVVMSKLFKHSHSQLPAAIRVTGVRVKGNQAYALLGSAAMPASYILLKRERGAWKIDALLGQPLP